MKALAASAVVILAIALLVHTSFVKRLAARAAVGSVAERLGGTPTLAELDYRLWAGEVTAEGISWTSDDGLLSVRARRVELRALWSGSPEVHVESPEVRAALGESAGAPVEYPGWLFRTVLTVIDGRLTVEMAESSIELSDLEVALAPDGAAWRGRVSTGRGVVHYEEAVVDIDSAGANVLVRTNGATISDAFVAAASSRIDATFEVTSWTPLALDGALRHTVDVTSFTPSITEGIVEGDATFRLSGGEVSGEGDARVVDLRVSDLERFSASGRWTFADSVVSVHDVDVVADRGAARVSGRFDLASDRQEITATFDGVSLPSPVGARARGSGTFVSSGFDPDRVVGEAEVELEALNVEGSVPLAGRATLALSDGVVRIATQALRGPGFQASANGTIGTDLDIGYDIRFHDLAQWGPLEGSAHVVGRATGPLSEPRASGRLTTDGVSVSGVPVELEASAALAGARLVIDDATLRHAGRSLAVTGVYDLDRSRLSVQGVGESFELEGVPDLVATIHSVEIALEMNVDAPLDSLSGRASVSLRDAAYQGVVLPDVDVVGEADGVRLELAALTPAGSRVAAADVRLAAPYPAQAELVLEALPIGELARALTGEPATEIRTRGRLHASGDVAEPDSVRFRIDADELVGSYRGIGFGVSPPVLLEGSRHELVFRGLTLVGADTAIELDGTLPLSRAREMDFRARGVARLELLSFFLEDVAIEGGVDLEVRASGTLDAPDLEGALNIAEGRVLHESASVEEVSAQLQFDRNHVRVHALSASVLPTGDTPMDEPVTVALSGELRGPFDDPMTLSGNGFVESLSLASIGQKLESRARSPWRIEQGRFELSAMELVGRETTLTARAAVDAGQEPWAWDASVSGQLDPALLAAFASAPGVRFTGDTEIDVAARSAAGVVDMSGTALIRNGRFSMRDPDVTISDLTARVRLAGDTIQLESLEARSGGGRITGSGTAKLDGTSVADLNLRGIGRSIRLSYPEGLRSEIDFDLELSGSSPDFRLGGEVMLDRAIFSRDINVQSELLQSLDRVDLMTDTASASDGVRLDIAIRTREGIRIDNNLARMEASASMSLVGTVREPELRGLVTARRGGEFRFGRNIYRIESGELELDRYPAAPPRLDIVARTSVADHDIRMSVSGPADSLVTEVTGTSRRDQSQLSRADAASLLVTGRKIDKVSTEGRAILAEQAASFLGSTLGDLAEFGLAGALPFDIVTVEPTLIAREADPSARFTLGAGLTESLSVVYSVGLNNPEKQIWIIDQQLPRQTRTQLIRQIDNVFTGALAHKIDFGADERTRPREEERAMISSVDFYLVTSEPGTLPVDARNELDVGPGSYDYWRVWERSEQLRDWLRRQGFLDATVDANAESCGDACVDLTVVAATGKRVRFDWAGGDRDETLEEVLARRWNGYVTFDFLAVDLAGVARAELFRERYYQASVDVTIEERIDEVEVSIALKRGPRGKGVDTTFRGNANVPSKTLLAALPRPSSAAYFELIYQKTSRLAQLIELQYASRGYLRATIREPVIAYDETTGVLHVEIPIEEGERFFVERVVLEGVEAFDPAVVENELRLEVGEPFYLDRFVSDRSSLAAWYRERGYPDVEVDSSVLEGSSADAFGARFTVREGPRVSVSDVRITGNSRTTNAVIERELALAAGKPLTQADITATQRRLYELGIFNSVDVFVPDTAKQDAERSIVVDVSEAPAVTLDYGLRLSTDGLFQVVADVAAPNLFGRAQGASIRALVGSNERTFRATYRTPYFARYKVMTDFFVERGVEDNAPVAGEDPDCIVDFGGACTPFTDRSWIFTAQQGRPLPKGLAAQWSYSFKRTETEFAVTEDTILAPFFSQNLSTFTWSLIGDFRDNVSSPKRGSFWSVTVQGTPQFFASDFKFVKLYSQLHTFVPLGRDVVWAGGYRAGAMEEYGQRLLEDVRFQAGGPNSVRGFEQDTLGPRGVFTGLPVGGSSVVIVNQELRFPIAWRFRGVGFYDAGNVFDGPSTIRLSELRQSFGAGVRFELPFGLIRLDWAKAVSPRDDEDPWRLIFSVGHAF